MVDESNFDWIYWSVGIHNLTFFFACGELLNRRCSFMPRCLFPVFPVAGVCAWCSRYLTGRRANKAWRFKTRLQNAINCADVFPYKPHRCNRKEFIRKKTTSAHLEFCIKTWQDNDSASAHSAESIAYVVRSHIHCFAESTMGLRMGLRKEVLSESFADVHPV